MELVDVSEKKGNREPSQWIKSRKEDNGEQNGAGGCSGAERTQNEVALVDEVEHKLLTGG